MFAEMKNLVFLQREINIKHDNHVLDSFIDADKRRSYSQFPEKGFISSHVYVGFAAGKGMPSFIIILFISNFSSMRHPNKNLSSGRGAPDSQRPSNETGNKSLSSAQNKCTKLSAKNKFDDLFDSIGDQITKHQEAISRLLLERNEILDARLNELLTQLEKRYNIPPKPKSTFVNCGKFSVSLN